MSNTKRFWDSIPMVAPEDAPPPLSVPELMIKLGIRRASDDVKRTAVAAWLLNNTPSRLLRDSIERRGWGDLLTEEAPPA